MFALLFALIGVVEAATPAQMEMAVVIADDLGQSWYDGPQSLLAERYKKLCAGGYAFACEYEKWHHAEVSHLAEANRVAKPLCDAGEPVACMVVGWQLQENNAADSEAKIPTHPEALALMNKVCEMGLPRGCTEAGEMYYNKLGVEKDDWPAAAENFKKGCDGGDMRGCYQLGGLYRKGHHVEQDNARALELRVKACSGGLWALCDLAGDYYRSGVGTEINFEKAAELFDLSCKNHYAEGCNHLAQAYEEGQGVGKSKLKADALHLQACGMGRKASCQRLDAEAHAEAIRLDDAGFETKFRESVCAYADVDACATLADAYDGAAFDDAAHAVAAQTYERACARGHQDSCSSLGYEYAKGEGVALDQVRAATLFKAACDAGESGACANMAELCEGGCGGATPADAVAYFQRACDHGSWDACTQVAIRYEHGEGVPKDVARARAVYENGCSWFDSRSCMRLALLVKSEDPKRAAQLMDTACLEGHWQSCTANGISHIQGWSGKVDAFKAGEAWRKACRNDDGNGTACTWLAGLHFEGVGTRKAVAEGVNLLVEGCTKGSALACDRLWLGNTYALYPGVDTAKAEAARKQGCALRGQADCAEAQVALGAEQGAVSVKAPAFPADAKKRGLTAGVCVLQLSVDAKGAAGVVDAADCEPGLLAASTSAAKGWKFQPGQARSIDVRLVYSTAAPTRLEVTTVPDRLPCSFPRFP
jgi:TPR repeat protein